MDLITLDTALLFFINRTLSNGIFDILMPAVSVKGYLLFFPFLCKLVLAGLSRKREDLPVVLWAIGLALCAFLLADWAGAELKKVVNRERPCLVMEGLSLLVGCGKMGSMPSNHAANSSAFAWPLFMLSAGILSRAWRIYPLAVALLIAFSRPYIGVHYPSDVIAGAALGIGIAACLLGVRPFILRRYAIAPHRTILFTVLACLSLFRLYYILDGPLDLSPDEAHYWEWSRRLDLSYYSKGPMIAYLIWIGTSLFGNSEFGVRFLAIVLNALSCLLIFRLATMVGRDERTGLLASLLFLIIPLFSTYGTVFTIDSPFIFFWTLSLYLFWKIIGDTDAPEKQRRSTRMWIALGIAVGLGLLTKYTMAFFLLCGLLFLLFSDRRHLLKTPFPYLAAAVSIAVFSPVLVWNMQHDWVTLRHTAGQANVAAGLVVSLKTFMQFIGSQAGVVTPLFFVVMLYTLFRPDPFFSRRQTRFILFFSVPVLLFFLLKSSQGKVQANWALTGYIVALIPTARYFAEGVFSPGSGRGRRRRYLLFMTSAVLAALIFAAGHFPLLFHIPPNLDPSARLRGWEQLGREVAKIREPLLNDGVVLIVSDSYQIASELAFYTKGNPETYCINLGRRMNQYDLWPGLEERMAGRKGASQPGGVETFHAMLVRQDDTAMPPDIAPACGRYEKHLVTVRDKGRPLRQYSVFVCYNFSGLSLERPRTF